MFLIPCKMLFVQCTLDKAHFYKVPEKHGHVYLVRLYHYLVLLFDRPPGAEGSRAPLYSRQVHVHLNRTIDKLVNLDRLQYTCSRLRSLGRNCKIYLGNGTIDKLSLVPTNRNRLYSMNHPILTWKYLTHFVIFNWSI